MSIYKCPKGHESTESDFCSECGTKIQGVRVASAINSVTSTVPQAAAVYCPDCTTPHDANGGNFCEICGYNFTTGAHGEVPVVGHGARGSQCRAGVPPVEATGVMGHGEKLSVASSESPIPDRQSPAIAFEVIATVDPSLHTEGSPPPPADRAPVAFQLDKESNLVGRRNERRGIHPEVALDFDDAVSHRHAILIRQPDGTLILRDIGSTNGTKLNGVELVAMVDTPIAEGDELTLGHWTRIVVRCRMKDEDE